MTRAAFNTALVVAGMGAALLLGAAAPADLRVEQATDDTVQDRALESRDLQLALYVADHDTARTTHPSAQRPVRRRHPSTTTTESTE